MTAVHPTRIPRIISVDDHVVEPPHVWETWLPARFRDRGPKVVRRGVREIRFAGAAAYQEEFDDDSPTKADTWVYEDLVYTHKRMVAAVGYPRDEMTMTPITYDDMRPGCYDPTRPARRHGRQLGRGLGVLPDVPAVLRSDLRRGQGQGARPRLRGRLQRLDRGGVVRRLGWAPDPRLPDPALGHRAGRDRSAPQRRAGRAGGGLQRDPRPPRPAEHPLRVVGPVLRRVRGDQHDGVHAHRLVVAPAGDVRGRATFGHRDAGVRRGA